MTARPAVPGQIPVTRPLLGPEEIAAAVRVLRTGQVAQGREVAAFEAEFAALVDGRHCVAVNSGTSALHLALWALRIGPGDEVIVPSFSFVATANAVHLVGARPVFADIDPASFCLDPDAVAAAITPRTAAIIPVHLFGHPAAMHQLVPLAARHGLAVIEDSAQAHAATLHGHPVGTFGDAGCFSFYPTKNMHALEGGMITTADPVLARTLRLLRNQGMEQRYVHEIIGTNMRLTDVAAAVGRVQLAHLADWTAQRRRNAAYLDAGLHAIAPPPVVPGARHVYHQYTVRIPGADPSGRDAFAAALARQHGVATAVYYPTPIHRQPAYNQTLDLPHTARAAAEVLALPVHPTLTEHDLHRIAAAVNTVAAGATRAAS